MLERLIGQKFSKEFYGKKFDIEITNIVSDVEEQEEYLDGSYTKEDLLEMAECLRESQKITKVYGKIAKKSDIKKLEGLQETYFESLSNCNATGCYPKEKDFRNEILLRIFKDGDEPEI